MSNMIHLYYSCQRINTGSGLFSRRRRWWWSPWSRRTQLGSPSSYEPPSTHRRSPFWYSTNSVGNIRTAGKLSKLNMYQKQDVKTWQSCNRKFKRYLSLRHCNLDVDSLCEHHLAHDVHLPHDVMIIMVHDGHQLIYKISRIKTLGPSFSSAMFLVSMTMLPAFVDIQVREGKASREKTFLLQ